MSTHISQKWIEKAENKSEGYQHLINLTYVSDLTDKMKTGYNYRNKHSSYEAMDNLSKSYILGHKITFKTFQRTEIIQSMFSDYSILS